MNILDLLSLFKPISEIDDISLGGENDGRYYVPSSIDYNTIDEFLTFGVGRDVSFEMDFLYKFGKKFDLYDGTIKHPPQKSKKHLKFFKQNITPSFLPINKEKMTFLKIDIEGAELDIIPLIDFSKIAVLLIELHNLHKKVDNNYNSIIKIKNDMLPYYAHYNNYYSFNYNNKRHGCAIELGFINKNFFKSGKSTFVNFKNNRHKPVINL